MIRTSTILHVDDNPAVVSFVGPELDSAGFRYVSASTGHEALSKLLTERPDLVVLDVMLGDTNMSGLDVCKRIREAGHRVPVIFLTVRDRTDDTRTMQRAFTVGGNDYISKREELRRIEERMGLLPTEFLERKSDIEELIVRIKAHLSEQLPESEFDGLLRIDFEGEEVHVNREGAWRPARLSGSQFGILRALVLNEGKGVTKSEVLAAAGTPSPDSDRDRVIQSHIYRLREQIEPDPRRPRFILTYHGFGYRFGGSPTAGLQ